jgi:hypothetical protein
LYFCHRFSCIQKNKRKTHAEAIAEARKHKKIKKTIKKPIFKKICVCFSFLIFFSFLEAREALPSKGLRG